MSDFRSTALDALTRHSSYTWNKSRTRIRCNNTECAAVLDTPDGEPSAVMAFALHQVDQLPVPVHPEHPPTTVATEVPADTEPDLGTEPEPESLEPTSVDDEPAQEDDDEAGDQQETTAAAPKFKRDTKALTATIAELQKGDRVRATFNHPRYGQFDVEGTVLKGGAGLDRGQLSVAGWYINLNARAAKALQDLVILAPAGKHEFAIPKPSDLNEHVGIGS